MTRRSSPGHPGPTHRFWRWHLLGLVGAALVTAAQAQPAEGRGAPLRSTARTPLPEGNVFLTPYAAPAGDVLLVHIQPGRGSGAETLVDARTGKPWTGTPEQVMKSFRRLGVETAAEVQAGRAWDQRALILLGCRDTGMLCTSPADADVVLMMRTRGGAELEMQVADLRAPMMAMGRLMAGEITAADVGADDTTWQVMELAVNDSSRRARWVDALRSIDDPERWQRLATAAEKQPRLLGWPSMSAGPGREPLIDLRAELELSALRLNLSMALGAALQRDAAPAWQAVADALLLGSRVGFRGDVPSHLVDLMLQLDEADRQRVSAALEAEARRRRQHVLWCYGEWVSARSCAAAPPWATVAVVGPAVTPSAGPSTSPTANPVPATRSPSRPTAPSTAKTPTPGAGVSPPAPAPAPAPVPAPAPSPPTTATAPPAPQPTQHTPATAATQPTRAGDAQQEWVLLKGQRNPLVLLSYSETSGLLAPEEGLGAGLSFVARSVGPVQEGRFEIAVAPSKTAPVLLEHGTYRVRVRVLLDFTRVDTCNGSVLCVFSGTERHARTERRDLEFTLSAANKHRARQPASFGHLLPLVANGSKRYSSKLEEARLAIDSVRFDLK